MKRDSSRRNMMDTIFKVLAYIGAFAIGYKLIPTIKWIVKRVKEWKS